RETTDQYWGEPDQRATSHRRRCRPDTTPSPSDRSLPCRCSLSTNQFLSYILFQRTSCFTSLGFFAAEDPATKDVDSSAAATAPFLMAHGHRTGSQLLFLHFNLLRFPCRRRFRSLCDREQPDILPERTFEHQFGRF